MANAGGGADAVVVAGDAVAGGVQVDPVSNLPLAVCPDCKDVLFLALTVRNPASVNCGRRFFKCPRNVQGVPGRCRRFYFMEDYERFLAGGVALVLASVDGVETGSAEDGSADGSGIVHDSDDSAAGTDDGGCGVVEKAGERGNDELQREVLCWVKFIAIQCVVLNMLMGFLVLLAVAR